MPSSNHQPIRIGFVALVDCAPLVIAKEQGLFEEAGLDIELIREPGWASIRDKIVYNELDAAHSVVGLCFAISWGLGVLKRKSLTGFLINSNGDSIVLAERLLDKRGQFANPEDTLTFGIPHWHSSHHFLLRQWLLPTGLKEGRDYRLFVLPPSLMVPSLKARHIDGFCVGEPYGSLAVNQKIGVVVKETVDLSPMHPEKALLVTEEFATVKEREHLRLISCLIKAAKYCDTIEGRKQAASILGHSKYLDLDPSVIKQSLLPDSDTIRSDDFHLFSKFGINEPTTERANWVVNHMRKANLIPDSLPKEEIKMGEVFRSDIYRAALDL